jgi:DNA-binding CsgD family transcriptional regulator
LLQARLSAGRFETDEWVDQTVVAKQPLAARANAEQLLMRGCLLQSAGAEVSAASPLQRAVKQLRAHPDARLNGLGCQAAIELGDDEALDALTSAWMESARHSNDQDGRASSLLHRGAHDVIVGELNAAAALFTIVSQQPQPRDVWGRDAVLGLLLVAAWRGHESVVRAQAGHRLEEATRDRRGAALNAVHHLLAVLENSLGNYEAARCAAEEACDNGWYAVCSFALSELAEAAVRSDAPEAAARAAERLANRALASQTDWALGMHHRAQALIDRTDSAEDSFRASLRHLARTTVLPQLGRTQLLYGEWLRRRGRRRAARLQLEGADIVFTAIGATGFAERSRNENVSTARHLRRAAVGLAAALTARELQVARLVAGGATNDQIGEQLYISPRTVEYHLRTIYRKLGLTTRVQLATHVARHDDARA